ncbi:MULTISPECIES: aminotransferase class V-fold PLP-dependent enzyme [Pseudoalteromonas]|uniref:Cysteine desulfurase n=1 Tax=Pseudoalteromonas maricaloris TaxID=184924 RepID=A0A8I2H3P9_9GAMM|nr:MULTISPECIES: cysteine desulfurase [Pseudoalteromonas]KID34680.1 cysteine sulfinate desulfinase [Pseudoalteromonas flavipulchra NCIMB 2033 = ATCC BAA-314]MBD0781405.1 cysteine desulfurase [Pseudoalteromonas flavipulchra]MBE0372707.1 cysteine desulfurase / selenocysteine lyase [Pseudoalteromonas flavipulchra NCIMB 2033 = ATCC BAA-314]NLR21317.1 cysteine desulfurase [Pseudoalteromonas maricaloris]WMO13720.1 cysteine desulfurase [Pseudoalteromonas piscicida]
MTDIQSLRNDFPILNKQLDGQPLCYLDSAATAQKPNKVIDVIKTFYQDENSNVHRGLHTLSENATVRYESARETIANFLNVETREIVWTSGATESLNLVAHGLSASLNSDSVIAISPFEHHANIVPWQEACQRTGATLLVLPMLDGVLDEQGAIAMLKQHKPDVLAMGHVSNALGNIHPIESLISVCKALGTITVIDGAQSLLHLRPDLKALECDFYVFSAHKALGPTGVGGLYGKYQQLNALPVYKTGGEMIKEVSFERSSYREAPSKFEPGTPNISGVIGFAAAIDYVNEIDPSALQRYEQALYHSLLAKLRQIEGITVYGDTQNNVGVVSFNYKNEHHYDLATLLNTYGVAVRSGHHCTQPLMKMLKVNGTVRASLAFYNNQDDIEHFINALSATIELLD